MTSTLQGRYGQLPEGRGHEPGARDRLGGAARREPDGARRRKGRCRVRPPRRSGRRKSRRRCCRISWKANVYVLQSEPPDIKLLVAASRGTAWTSRLIGNVRLDPVTGQVDDDLRRNAGVPVHGLQTVLQRWRAGGTDRRRPGAGCTRSTSDFTPWSLAVHRRCLPVERVSDLQRPGWERVCLAVAVHARR